MKTIDQVRPSKSEADLKFVQLGDTAAMSLAIKDAEQNLTPLGIRKDETQKRKSSVFSNASYKERIGKTRATVNIGRSDFLGVAMRESYKIKKTNSIEPLKNTVPTLTDKQDVSNTDRASERLKLQENNQNIYEHKQSIEEPKIQSL